MTITIEDISKQLGISVSTISKALNDYPDVSPSTKERVQVAAREMGYYPNTSARNLRRGRTDKIGLLINNPIEFLSEYIGDVMSGAAVGAERFNQNLMLYTKEVVHPDELQRICRAREVDGLLLIFDPAEASLAVLEHEQIPFVVFGRRTINPNVSFIAPDNLSGALELTRHLIAQGHRRIGFTTRPQLNLINTDRFGGYKLALEEAGIPFDPTLVVETRTGQHDGYDAMVQLLDLPDPPTALFAFYDMMAADAMRAVNERGLRVPDDIAIAGFDGLKLSRRTQPALTTVRQPLARMGERAIEMLMARIEDNSLPPTQRSMPVQFIVRESTLSTRQ
jgi:DNA-binding LacI/PurR family transcriptional regulator